MNRPRTLTVKLALSAFSLALASAAWAENITIVDVAPKEAALVVSVDNFAATRASFDKTGLRKVWDDPKIKAWVMKHSEEVMEEFSKSLEESGIKFDELSPPSGTAGLAAWLAWGKESNKPEMRMISIADYADKADETAKIIEEAIQTNEDKKQIKVKEDDYAGHKVYIIEPIEQEKPKAEKPKPKTGAEEADDAGPEDGDEGDMPKRDGPFEMKQFVYSRAGSILMIGSDADSVERAIDRIGGKATSSVAESAELGAVLKQLGGAKDYAVMLTGPLVTMLDKVIDEAKAGNPNMEPGIGEDPRITTLLQISGLAGVKAAGIGVRFDTDSGMAEQTFGVLASEKKGLLSLVAAPDAKFAAPAFVSGDAGGITLFQFKFAELIPTVLEVIKQLPPDFAQQGEMYVQQATGMIGPLLAQMGPQVYLVQSYAKPFTAKSSAVLGAIALKDAAAFNQAVGNVGPMVGLQSRDFQGNQIWSGGEGGMGIPGLGDVSLGVGFGHLFIGATPAVENALRQAGNENAAGLAKEARFTTAMRSLKDAGLSFSYNDMRQTLEWTEWSMKNSDKIAEEQMNAMFGDDPEAKQYKEDMVKRMKENQPAWVKDMPALDVFMKEIGDTVFEFHSTPEGFQGRSIWLRPVAK